MKLDHGTLNLVKWHENKVSIWFRHRVGILEDAYMNASQDGDLLECLALCVGNRRTLRRKNIVPRREKQWRQSDI